MPLPRTLLLFQCVEAASPADVGRWWLAECYLTSDGPRMRLLAPHATEEAARTAMVEINAKIAGPNISEVTRRAYDNGYRAGQNDGLSRARNSPGNGDMGG